MEEKYHNTLNIIDAAWPSQESIDNDVEEGLCTLDDLKDLMNKYFPWRLKNDEIQYINDYED